MSSISLDEYNEIKESAKIVDIRLDRDYEASEYILPNSEWKDPSKVEEWLNTIPKKQKVILYCVHGRSISKGVTESLRTAGIDASFIEGGIEGIRELGAEVNTK